jgi:hypothetical protein
MKEMKVIYNEKWKKTPEDGRISYAYGSAD